MRVVRSREKRLARNQALRVGRGTYGSTLMFQFLLAFSLRSSSYVADWTNQKPEMMHQHRVPATKIPSAGKNPLVKIATIASSQMNARERYRTVLLTLMTKSFTGHIPCGMWKNSPSPGGRTHAITVPSLAKKSELFIRK